MGLLNVKQLHNLYKKFGFVSTIYQKTGLYRLQPMALIFHLTFLCNHKCTVCNQRDRDFIDSSIKDMDVALFARIAGQAQRFPIKPFIHFTGGEPMVHKKFGEILDITGRLGLRVSITTNGSKIPEYADRIIASRIHNIHISVDGIGDVHDTSRQSKGAFAKVLDALKCMEEAKKAGSTSSPRLVINLCINPRNHAQLYEFASFWRDKPVDGVNFQHLMFNSRAEIDAHKRYFKTQFDYDSRYNDDYIVESTGNGFIDADVLKKQMLKIAAEKWPFEIKTVPDIDAGSYAAYYSFGKNVFARKCAFPWLLMRIFPDGVVSQCFGKPFGDLRKESLIQAWRNGEMERFRAKLSQAGIFPGCERCCHRVFK